MLWQKLCRCVHNLCSRYSRDSICNDSTHKCLNQHHRPPQGVDVKPGMFVDFYPSVVSSWRASLLDNITTLASPSITPFTQQYYTCSRAILPLLSSNITPALEQYYTCCQAILHLVSSNSTSAAEQSNLMQYTACGCGAIAPANTPDATPHLMP